MAWICAVLALVGACIALALGVAVFPRKLRDVFVSTTPNPVREAQVVAVELEALLRKEIDATKRGDLLAAAGYADRAEVIRG